MARAESAPAPGGSVGRDVPSSVRLYGVLSAAHGDAPAAGSGRGHGRRYETPAGLAVIELLRVRDLVAAVAPAPFAASPPTPGELAATHAVVAALFVERAILPAAPGTVFRSREAVAAWVELHAAALSEALRYVEDRVEARVHVERLGPGGALPGAPAPGPLPEVLRVLRGDAVALLVLREQDAAEPAGELAARAAFLVERAHWGAFAAAVAREQGARSDLRLALTGPWPPYDFVRLDLGG